MEPSDTDEDWQQQRLRRGPTGVATGSVIAIHGRAWLLNRRGIVRFSDYNDTTWHCTIANYYGPLAHPVEVRYLLDDPSCNRALTIHPVTWLVVALKILLTVLALVAPVGLVLLLSRS
jgi:hypothetical protein